MYGGRRRGGAGGGTATTRRAEEKASRGWGKCVVSLTAMSHACFFFCRPLGKTQWAGFRQGVSVLIFAETALFGLLKGSGGRKTALFGRNGTILGPGDAGNDWRGPNSIDLPVAAWLKFCCAAKQPGVLSGEE